MQPNTRKSGYHLIVSAEPSKPIIEPAASEEELQFLRAQFRAAPTQQCQLCKKEIDESFYQLGAAEVCPACAVDWHEHQKPGGILLTVKGFLFGLGGAIVGWAMYFGVLYLGFEIGVIGLAVGWLVGKGMRIGTEGHAGRIYQFMAILLTYMAISMAIAPSLYTLLAERMPPATDLYSTAARVLLASGISLISPFLIVRTSPVSGLLSLLIMFFGMAQAWRLNGRSKLTLAGPFLVKSIE